MPDYRIFMLGLHTSIGITCELNSSESTFGRDEGHIFKRPIQIKKSVTSFFNEASSESTQISSK